jgi:hypothetical protein
MLFRLLLLLGLTLPLAATAAAAVPPSSAFQGTWRFDAERSTNLPAWRSFELTVELTGSTVAMKRRLGWGRRVHEDSLQLPLDGRRTAVPVPYWADNRHIGAYIGGDGHKHAHLRVLDDGRILRIESDLTVETQQGDRAINVLSDYHLSPDGQTLTLIEIRSSRPRPTVTVLTRVQP